MDPHARRDEEEEPAGVSGMDARKECFRFVSKTVCNHVTMYQRNIVIYDHQKSITLKKKFMEFGGDECHQCSVE